MKKLMHLEQYKLSKKQQMTINGGGNACESTCNNACYHQTMGADDAGPGALFDFLDCHMDCANFCS